MSHVLTAVAGVASILGAVLLMLPRSDFVLQSEPTPKGDEVPPKDPRKSPRESFAMSAGAIDRNGAIQRDAEPYAALVLPTGERVPTLNGVLGVIELTWPRTEPYSPIVGTVRAGTIEWYVHENGTHSTTQTVYRADLGREVPVAVVAGPAPVVPVAAGR